MSTSNTTADSVINPEAVPVGILSKTRPFYWSVRREIWENRSIYLAPLAIAAVVVFGMLIGAINLPQQMVHLILTLEPAKQAEAVSIPYDFAAFAILLTSFIVAAFYCLGALHGERRDRTILFWKSLPVSDLTTVLAKASVALVILPLITFAIILATLLIMLALSAVILPAKDLPAALLWTEFPLPKTSLDLLYTLAILSLWYAPIWGWLLLISGWARRVPFLWAAGPPLALIVFERLAFNSSYLWSLLKYRITGAMTEGFAAKIGPKGQIGVDTNHLDPIKFLATLGLWVGLAVAAALLAAAVWQRRRREPI
jgi:ABC-2 type transport system permease protein